MTAFEPLPERRPVPAFTCSPPYHRLDCVGVNCDDAETRDSSIRARWGDWYPATSAYDVWCQKGDDGS